MNKVEVFICEKCGFEDSSIVPMYKEKETVTCTQCNQEVAMNITNMNYEPYLTMREYVELVQYIHENHSFSKGMGKRIKYVTMTLDFRSLTIHRVVLDDKEFTKVNENRHRNLKTWILDYLNS